MRNLVLVVMGGIVMAGCAPQKVGSVDSRTAEHWARERELLDATPQRDAVSALDTRPVSLAEARAVGEQTEGRALASLAERPARATLVAPDIGATPNEAKSMCENQGGSVDVDGRHLSCVDRYSAPMFSAFFKNGRADGVISFWEGQSVAIQRAAFEQRLGRKPDDERIVAGFRTYIWSVPGGAVGCRMYERGMSLTVVQN